MGCTVFFFGGVLCPKPTPKTFNLGRGSQGPANRILNTIHYTCRWREIYTYMYIFIENYVKANVTIFSFLHFYFSSMYVYTMTRVIEYTLSAVGI